MKKYFLFLFTIFISFVIKAQCSIHPYIQENYDFDAKLLALRDILSDPTDPDHFNPYIPEERFIPYLEKLSAIYENPNNDPEITAFFEDFNIHVNQEYNYQIELETIAFSVDITVPWVEDFLDTGISGNSELNQLMEEYQFNLDHYWNLNGNIICFIKTDIEFLNLNAIIEDFNNIQDLNYAEIYFDSLDLRFNYTGVPYEINGENVAVADILINNDIYTFSLYAGDCFNGCLYSISWNVEVTDDCEVQLLSMPENNKLEAIIYPNPVSEILHIEKLGNENYTLKLYSIQGKEVRLNMVSSSAINVENLSSGIYFLEITTSEGLKEVRKFVKQ